MARSDPGIGGRAVRFGFSVCASVMLAGCLGRPLFPRAADRVEIVDPHAMVTPLGGRLCGGEMHTCAVLPFGTLYCWGNNLAGQWGDGTQVNNPSGSQSKVANVQAVACGDMHTCALDLQGSVFCFGRNEHEQLGDPQRPDGTPTPVKVSLPAAAVAVAAGGAHSCAVLQSGKIFCWGHNDWGQSGGANHPNDVPVPTEVSGLSDAATVDCGDDHCCAVRSDGGVACWGLNTFGKVGPNAGAFTHLPKAVPQLDAVAIAAGDKHSCAVLGSGQVMCWGSNFWGQLGAPTPAVDVPNPVQATGITNAVLIAGGHDHTCALLSDKTVKCWGNNRAGEVGQPPPTQVTQPTRVQRLPPAHAVAAGDLHSCALVVSSKGRLTVKCWGQNWYGMLTDGTTNSSSTPVP